MARYEKVGSYQLKKSDEGAEIRVCIGSYGYIRKFKESEDPELIKKGHVHYTDIEKKACATCLRFATTNTIRKQFCHYLLPNGYVQQVRRRIIQSPRKEKNS